VLFPTGNGTSTDTIICTLELVNNDWFKRALVGAIELMCNENNWSQRGDADIDFARDKANEMVESLQIDVIIPTFPIGSVSMWFTSVAPAKWLLLKGGAISKTTYPELFDIFGYAYGGGFDTFLLPTMNDYMPIGAVGSIALGATGGSNSVNLTQAMLPNVSFPVTDGGHAHAVTDAGHNHQQVAGNGTLARLTVGGGTNVAVGSANNAGTTPANTATSATGIAVNPATTGVTVSSGGSGAGVPIRPAARGVNFIIYAGR